MSSIWNIQQMLISVKVKHLQWACADSMCDDVCSPLAQTLKLPRMNRFLFPVQADKAHRSFLRIRNGSAINTSLRYPVAAVIRGLNTRHCTPARQAKAPIWTPSEPHLQLKPEDAVNL